MIEEKLKLTFRNSKERKNQRRKQRKKIKRSHVRNVHTLERTNTGFCALRVLLVQLTN